MLNMTSAQAVVADNTITINGVAIGNLTDSDAKKVWDIVNGMVSAYGDGKAVATPKTGLVFEEDLPKPERQHTAPTDVTVKIDGKDNAVWYAANSQDVRTVVNAQLKTAGFVYDKEAERPDTYKVDYTGRDGIRHLKGENKKGAWVLMKGSKRDISGAKAWIGKTITVTAQERQSIRDGWEARKERKNRG